jgi:hypothetical protein
MTTMEKDMAGIDKTNEFYTCASRFAFLSSCYRPENLPADVNEALDVFMKFCSNNSEFKERISQAEEYFEKMDEQLELYRKQELMGYLMKQCVR